MRCRDRKPYRGGRYAQATRPLQLSECADTRVQPRDPPATLDNLAVALFGAGLSGRLPVAIANLYAVGQGSGSSEVGKIRG